MARDSTWSLLKQRRFAPFFWTQFLGAFNDNVFKNALLILVAFQGARWGVSDSDVVNNLAAGLFVLPFFLFSPLAGQLADKVEKSRLIRQVKVAEIVIMAVAVVGFYLQSLWVLMAVLFCLGTQSSVFGPVKYSILPQHLKDEELVAGNGLVEMGTFLAILLGTVLGGVLIEREVLGPWLVSAMVLALALAGYLVARGIPKTPAVAPDLKLNWNIASEIGRIFAFTYRNRTVFLSIIGISWFWFFGAVYLTQFPRYTEQALGGNEHVGTLLLAAFSVGIGLGSLLCDRMSGHKVELGLVPFGSIGITVFAVDLYFATGTVAEPAETLMGPMAFLGAAGGLRVLTDIVLLSMFGGFYIVPLYALIQQRSTPSHRSRIIAGNNLLNALAMVLAAALGIVLLGPAELDIPQLFLVVAAMNAAVAIYIYTLVPEFLMRFLVWMAIHTIYRVRKEGFERIPEEGPAVLVCNHVSYADALVIGGCVRRPVRFVMYHKIFKIPVLSFIFRTAKAIPIAPAKEDPALLEKAYEDIDAVLAEGELVCIFPEGGITADGELGEFRSGIERIIERRAVPVVPMALSGLYGSIFSRANGGPLYKLPRKLWARIGLAVGEAVAPEAVTAERLREKVAALGGEMK